MKKRAAISGLAQGILVFLLGVLILTGAVLEYEGSEASYTTFGADFYTYSYRATRYAANNIHELGELVQAGLGLILAVAGAAGIVLSVYALGAIQESAEQTQLLRSILMKMDKQPSAREVTTQTDLLTAILQKMDEKPATAEPPAENENPME